MSKKTDGNVYTVVFAVGMVLVVGALLAFLASESALKPFITENKRIEKQQNILYAMGVNENQGTSAIFVSTDIAGSKFKEFLITGKLPTTTKPESETLNIDDILPKPGQNDMGEGGAQFGTRGFRDFGAGTPMMLHGSEMVLPERNVGELAEKLANAVSTLGSGNINTNTTVGDTITNNSTTIDLSTLNANTRELIALTEKTANHLNTLVTIGTMTEKNTKSTNKSLADMGGSLV